MTNWPYPTCFKCKRHVTRMTVETLRYGIKFEVWCHGEYDVCEIPFKELVGGIKIGPGYAFMKEEKNG